MMKGFVLSIGICAIGRGSLAAGVSALALMTAPAHAQDASAAAPETGAAAQTTPPTDATQSDDGLNQPGQSDIVVIGVRGAQKAAVDIKRNAPQIVDSIVAEDIGKLPDITIADSLQRVPGVQISRSAGEGAAINIRGLPQVLVTLNGEQFIGGQNIINAQPSLADIPPTLFSGVDVYKSPTASQLEGGVSGIVSLRTRRPLDLEKGVTLTGNLEQNYGDRADHYNSLVSGLAGYNGERWGVLLSGSYSTSLLANYDYDNGTSWRKSPTAGSDQSANSEFFYQPDVPNISNRTTERDRYGLNASGQLLVGSAFTVTAEGSYNRLKNTDRAAALNFNSNFGPLTLQPGSVVDSNGVLEVARFRLTDWNSNTQSSPSTSRAINTNLQVDYDNGGRFTGTLRWVHGDAKRHLEHAAAGQVVGRDNIIPRGGPATCGDVPGPTPTGICQYANPGGLPFTETQIDYRGTFPAIQLISDVTNPALYTLVSTWADGTDEKATLDAYRADASYDTKDLLPLLTAFRIGARYGDRDVRHTQFKYLAPVVAGLDSPSDLYYYKDPTIIHRGPTVSGYSIVPLRPFSSIPQYVRQFYDFGPVLGIPAAGVPVIDPRALDDPKGFQDALFPGNVAYTDPTTSFRVTEQRISGYVQADFANRSGLAFSGNVGLRVVHTKRTIYSSLTDPSQFIGTAGNYNGVQIVQETLKNTKEFTDWLPTANIAFDLTDSMKLRLAFSKVVGAQNLFDLAAGEVRNYRTNGSPGSIPGLPADQVLFGSGSAGNPDLEPYRSTNYNASYEFYFGSGGLLSVGAFLFDIASFPEVRTTVEPIPDADGVVRLGGPFTRTVNGKGGTIKGLEVGYQQNFDFLPGFLDGFGANANYTYSDSSSANVDLFGKALPVPDNSKHQVNLIGFYQKYGVQARVAYNWRSDRYIGLQAAGDDNLAIFAKPQGYLDASISYDVTPKFTVYGQATNLTRTHDEQYLQFKNQLYSEAVYDRRFFLGVRFRN